MLRDFISIPARSQGWVNKYEIRYADGTNTDPEAIYFPLRLDTDPRAREAALFYAERIAEVNPDLAKGIREKVREGEEIQARNSGYAE